MYLAYLLEASGWLQAIEKLFTDIRPNLYNSILKEIFQALWQATYFINGVYIVQVNIV